MAKRGSVRTGTVVEGHVHVPAGALIETVLQQRKSIEQIVEASDRFTLRRRLGAGGMGVVYEAYDQRHDALVALKTLRAVNPGTLYLFKQEFRALADVTHPNLVTLYELLMLSDQWFFTMELLAGRNILAYLRGEKSDEQAEVVGWTDATTTATLAPEATGSDASITAATLASVTGESHTPEQKADPVDGETMRPVLLQLGEALMALHSTGHLHCDIKPSNVLVTEEGRVVVLDYGVITAMTSGSAKEASFKGTPAYASPEQAKGKPPTTASDWYSFGVILYQALTGQRPFSGTSSHVLSSKQLVDPMAPGDLCPTADAALAALCRRLLDRDPSKRPSGPEILTALGGSASAARHTERATSVGVGAVSSDVNLALVGRERELTQLREAFKETLAGKGVAVAVKGRSGMGKSSLVEHFLDGLADQENALVLSGRCYERESVPHQAVDGLVDSLCRYLLDLPLSVAEPLMPLDVQAMARAFPVLGRVEAVAHAKRRSKVAVSDPVELRTRAFAALRELFARLAERQPLVLFIDDLQWGDVDSAPFLADLLRPPTPPLLLVISYRSEEITSSALLQNLLGVGESAEGPLAQARKIPIGRLSLPQAHTLATVLLTSAGAPATLIERTAEKIARESGGNPYFIHELVRFVSAREDTDATGVPPLEQVLIARAEALSENARKLLHVVAVAGRPLPEVIARRAANLGEEHPRALAELRTAHMVRTSGADASAIIETYHDRIRQSVWETVPEDQRKHTHLRIAESLVAADVRDPEALAMHYAAADEGALAGEYAARAADKAADALAFDRAAAFYSLALEQCAADDHDGLASLGRKCGDALVNAGRGADAWQVYLDAAAVATPANAQDLEVRAGTELLHCGRVADGVEVLRTPLASAGITLASSTAGAALKLLSRRAFSRLRGIGFKQREVGQIAPETLTQIDACHAMAAGLAMVDPLHGAYVQTRHLMMALKHGDPFRIGRALTYEAGFLCIAGKSIRPRVNRILRTVHELADQSGEPYLEALHHTHSSLAAYQSGEWAHAMQHARIAEDTYRDKCTGKSWEFASVQLYRLWSLYWLGEFQELADRARDSLRDAQARGDVFATVSLNIGIPSFSGLVVDDLSAARARAQSAVRQWTADGYHLQHFWMELALAHCDLYGGDAAAASERIEAQWPKLKRVFLLKIAMLRAEVLHVRARCALAAAMAAEDPSEQQRYLRLSATLAKKLAKQQMDWCSPAASLVEAGLLNMRGETEQAVALLNAAEQGLRAADTHGFAVAAMRWRGELMAGAEGARVVAESEAWLSNRGVANVDRMVRFLAPGFEPSKSDDSD